MRQLWDQGRRLWLPILEGFWELVCNNNSPDNRHIIAKIFYKYFYSISNTSVFLPQCGNCGAAISGLQKNGGGNESQAIR